MPDVAPRLDVDVARALLEGVLPQPVDDVDDVLVVGVELLVRLAELDQLLEVRRGRRAGRSAAAPRPSSTSRGCRTRPGSARCRAGWRSRAGSRACSMRAAPAPSRARAARRSRSPLPCALTATGRMRKRVGVGGRHHLGDGGEIDLQRIDVEVLQPGLRSHSVSALERERLVRRLRRPPLLVGDDDQRMQWCARCILRSAMSCRRRPWAPGRRRPGRCSTSERVRRWSVAAARHSVPLRSWHGGKYSQRLRPEPARHFDFAGVQLRDASPSQNDNLPEQSP